jgi:triosephosphate isomerase
MMAEEKPMRPRYIGASTKMYLGYQASLDWMERVRQVVDERPQIGDGEAVRPFVIPSFPLLESAQRIFEGSCVWVGAQNCSWSGGALTGEVSADLLAEMGVRIVEIGHAERRAIFGEDDKIVQLKTVAAQAVGLTPLLCIGESVRGDPTVGAHHCRVQVLAALGGRGDLSSLIIAYEPVWAIGASQPAEPAYVNAVIGRLRQLLAETHPATRIRIIYGGSAGPGLLPELTGVDGLFLGRFAHDPDNFGSVLDEALAQAHNEAEPVTEVAFPLNTAPS